MEIERSFTAADRYLYDFRKCPASEGWAQVDTRQDAPYYGTWANPTLRKIVNYCEGDVTVTHCDNDAEFIQAVREMQAWNAEREYWIGIDGMCVPEIITRFEALGLGELLH
jgi:hypothetical protein